MIQRTKEDRRVNNLKVDHNNRKNIGRRKNEVYSLYTYKFIVIVMLSIILIHAGLVIFN